MSEPRMRARRLAACGAVMLSGAAAPAMAQAPDPLQQLRFECDAARMAAAPPPTLDAASRPRWPSQRFARLRPLLAEQRWLDALDSVRTSLDLELAALDPASARQLEGLRQRLAITHDSTRAYLALLGAATSRDVLRAAQSGASREIGPARYLATGQPDSVIFFDGTDTRVALGERTSAAVRRAACWHAGTARLLLDSLTRPARSAAALALASKRAAWTSYFDEGYSQLPWELWLNSRAARSAARLDPPRRQWIVAHPSAGLVVAGPSLDRIGTNGAVAIELLGHLWYRDPVRFSRYLGVSGTVVFADDVGTSVGPFVHFGQAAKIGWVVPVRPSRAPGIARSGGVLLSVDLYRYLTDRKGEAAQVLRQLESALGR
ncbi:MAG: hypothetical protein MUF21_13625 [Gemmatimonadaceae bacterium]|nr:hypothetical protein [Gemmatimonadaceae bacterium]